MSSLPKIAIACAAATALLTGHAAAEVTVKDVKIQLLSQVDHKVFDPSASLTTMAIRTGWISR